MKRKEVNLLNRTEPMGRKGGESMASEGQQYSISRRGRLIDLEPMRRSELPLVWDPDRHKWVDLELTFGEHVDAVPITDGEAKRFMRTGEKSGRVQGRQVSMSDDISED